MTRPKSESKQDIINDREMEMSNAAFCIILILRHGEINKYDRAVLLEQHFNLAYHWAHLENRVEHILRAERQHESARQLARQPGLWPADHFSSGKTIEVRS